MSTDFGGRLEAFFQIRERGSNLRTEVLAGLTTFFTCVYTIAVNPAMMTEAGMDKTAVFWATTICCAYGSIVMGLAANLPLAQAPGMGLNAYFIYYVVGSLGLSWQNALGCVFLSGVFFVFLSFFKLQQKIADAVPDCVKYAVGPGIGFFIAFVGLTQAGLVRGNPVTLVELGDFSRPGPLLACAGLLLTVVLYIKKVRGAILLGILAVTFAGLFVTDPATGRSISAWPAGGLLRLENPLAALAPTLGQLSFKGMFGHSGVLLLSVVFTIFSFLMVDLLNGVAGLLGTAAKVGYFDEQGRLPIAGRAMMVTAASNIPAALLGAHTVVIYGAESASGIAEGGRTGLTAVVCGLLFASALVLAPLFLMVPLLATAPALIMVGIFMMEPLKYIDLGKFEEAFPAFFGVMVIPLTYSIAHGILLAILAYTLTRLVSGRRRELNGAVWALSAALGLFLGLDLLLKILARSAGS